MNNTFNTRLYDYMNKSRYDIPPETVYSGSQTLGYQPVQRTYPIHSTQDLVQQRNFTNTMEREVGRPKESFIIPSTTVEINTKTIIIVVLITIIIYLFVKIIIIQSRLQILEDNVYSRSDRLFGNGRR